MRLAPVEGPAVPTVGLALAFAGWACKLDSGRGNSINSPQDSGTHWGT